MKLFKKLLFLLFIELTILFFYVGFSGCQTEDNCKFCTNCFINDNEGTYCESDFNSADTYNETIDELVNGGCECD